MKIISKEKDYYDHEVLKFGYDETRILDRRTPKEWGGYKTSPMKYNYNQDFFFAIAGEMQVVLLRNGFFYFEKDSSLKEEDNREFIQNGNETKANQKFGCPVILLGSSYDENWVKDEGFIPYSIPILKEFGFASIFSSAEMYSKIYDYLGWLKDNPAPESKMNDKEKIVSHGFDKKTSFRPKIKI